MDQATRKKLETILDRMVVLRDQRTDIDEETKELVEKAQADCNVQPKVCKQLAKEKGWNEIERMRQKQFEEELDDARLALGLLADTPLGEHATAKIGKKGGRKPAREPAHV